MASVAKFGEGTTVTLYSNGSAEATQLIHVSEGQTSVSMDACNVANPRDVSFRMQSGKVDYVGATQYPIANTGSFEDHFAKTGGTAAYPTMMGIQNLPIEPSNYNPATGRASIALYNAEGQATGQYQIISITSAFSLSAATPYAAKNSIVSQQLNGEEGAVIAAAKLPLSYHHTIEYRLSEQTAPGVYVAKEVATRVWIRSNTQSLNQELKSNIVLDFTGNVKNKSGYNEGMDSGYRESAYPRAAAALAPSSSSRESQPLMPAGQQQWKLGVQTLTPDGLQTPNGIPLSTREFTDITQATVTQKITFDAMQLPASSEGESSIKNEHPVSFYVPQKLSGNQFLPGKTERSVRLSESTQPLVSDYVPGKFQIAGFEQEMRQGSLENITLDRSIAVTSKEGDLIEKESIQYQGEATHYSWDEITATLTAKVCSQQAGNTNDAFPVTFEYALPGNLKPESVVVPEKIDSIPHKNSVKFNEETNSIVVSVNVPAAQQDQSVEIASTFQVSYTVKTDRFVKNK